MRIADGLEILQLQGNGGVLNLSLVWDNENVVLFDTGLPGQAQVIRSAIENAGVSVDKLNKIIITHQDMDHIGSLSTIVRESDHKIEVLSHEMEKPYIEGDKRPIKMTPEFVAKMEAQLAALPEEKRKAIKAMYSNINTKVDTPVQDGQQLPYCGGITIIHTPGHTPGHICLYLDKYKTLIAGDAMNVVDGKLLGPNPQYTFNVQEAVSSLKKILRYDIQTIICYHGGVFNDNVSLRIAELSEGK